jgi:hypothetical protein
VNDPGSDFLFALTESPFSEWHAQTLFFDGKKAREKSGEKTPSIAMVIDKDVRLDQLQFGIPIFQRFIIVDAPGTGTVFIQTLG